MAARIPAMRRLLLVPLLGLVAAAATACSSPSREEPATTQAVYDRIRAAGVELGPLQPLTEPGFQTQEKGWAQRPDGNRLYVYIPVKSWEPDAFLPLLELAGGYVVYGDRWVVHVTDRPTAEKIADRLGGKLR